MPVPWLHPLQGAPARGQAAARSGGGGGLGRAVRQAGHRSRQAARLEGERGRQDDRRPRQPQQAAQGELRAGPRPLQRSGHAAGERRGWPAERELRPRGHRHRVAAGADSVAVAGQRADDGLHHRPGAARRAALAAGDRRRLHRPGARLGVCRARLRGHRGGDAAGAPARRRPRPGGHPGPAGSGALRQGAREHARGGA